jgi:hypothetical protein
VTATPPSLLVLSPQIQEGEASQGQSCQGKNPFIGFLVTNTQQAYGKVDSNGSVLRPCGETDDAYIMEVTSEETGRTQKIVSMKFVESEKMTRCVSVGCDKNDVPIENLVTSKFP